ncbi:MAG TPA: MBL fold metallo-hydrolase [Saprospiraceae bacterium]|nr:MBL fold metallo-hydrolase [Saprospiraceae bacterium]HNG90004.1 MBL fold metallo-hydrolase [Saprospiraceae bacterium]
MRHPILHKPHRFMATLTLLGTGTSQGVPVIGCDCPVCSSADPHDNRLRSSALVSAGPLNLLIDAGPDLRQQMLRAQVRHLDAILLTHEHNDHVIGLDDIRPFNFRSGQAMHVYALPRVAGEVRRRFDYVFAEPIPGLPRIELLELRELSPLSFAAHSPAVQPISVLHGRLPILGFRMGELAYLTDLKTLPESEHAKLRGLKYLIVNALHHRAHPTHMNLEEALAFIEAVQPQQAWLTHIGHHMGLAQELQPLLPPQVRLAYDGLKIEFEWGE